MLSIVDDFAEALCTVSRPGTFFVAGTENMLAPGLAVEGVGPVALPLLPMQAEQLIAVAERAPYGRGAETLTDTAVRRTWQIGAEHVFIGGKHWPATLKTIVGRVAEGLGVTDPVEAELYKLLIYDEGSFFVPHRDTEKAPGMFATLVLALPSVSVGGELIVRHKDREARLELLCEEPSDVAFAAFYADCVHEVRPVTSGCRLVLLYNLIRQGPGRQPEAPNYGDETQTISALLQEWTEALREPEHVEPLKLIYPLEHAYTPAELSFQTLKGADAGIAEIVAAAARQAGCDVHLALVSIEENGTAVQTGGSSRYRRGRYDDNDDDDDEFEIVEMSDRAATASNWRRRDGEASPLTEIPIHEDEFSPAVLFEDLEPDEEHFQEATGNAGASYERTYSRTALILWPREQLLAVINQAGLVVTLPFLEDLVGRWSSSGDVSIRERARELSLHMIRDWDLDRWYAERSNNITPVGRFLDALRTLDDTPGLTAFLTRLANRPGFDPGDCAPTAAALRVIPAHEASILAARLIESAAKSALAPCAALLNNISAAEPTLAKAAARVLVAALPGDSERGPAITLWQRDLIPPPELIVDLFTALGRIDPTLAAVSADHILEWPATYDFDTVLIPAVLRLRDIPETAAQPAVQRLRDTCLAHLDARIALPLAAPVDWQRNDSVSCTCRDCHALAAYLRNASQQVWTFPAAEPRRRHVESTIQTSRCDVNTATQRRGSPHQLICTKNQASYERRRKQRIHDIDQRASLLAPDAQ